MKVPADCSSLSEIRTEIDRIDREIVSLIGERAAYVAATVPFKADEMAVRAPDRFAAMLVDRRRWATEAGVSPELIERLYQILVSHFIQVELEAVQARM